MGLVSVSGYGWYQCQGMELVPVSVHEVGTCVRACGWCRCQGMVGTCVKHGWCQCQGMGFVPSLNLALTLGLSLILALSLTLRPNPHPHPQPCPHSHPLALTLTLTLALALTLTLTLTLPPGCGIRSGRVRAVGGPCRLGCESGAGVLPVLDSRLHGCQRRWRLRSGC